ncbi:uncharacterized protein LOC132198915 [Neocloeon triangulifer]|uniref:uncharacterized protein LOC132198915 n=1 Tax=Neocloeon triangulifer TaxID=2078957 RepID=UPI00286F0E6C|nr:uncharacterized protein LOC132198915 [Neocloeon triangulifer]
MDNFKIEFDRLNEEFVRHECVALGIEIGEKNITALRAELKAAHDAFASGARERPVIVETPAVVEELNFISVQVGTVKARVQDVANAKSATEARKVRAQIAYLRECLLRLKPAEGAERCKGLVSTLWEHLRAAFNVLRGVREEDPEQVGGEQAQANAALFDELNETVAALGDVAQPEIDLDQGGGGLRAQSTPRPQPSWFDDVLLYLPMRFDAQRNEPVPLLADAAAGGLRSFPEPRRAGKMIPVADWKIQFSGEAKEKVSFADFLFEVSLKREECNLSESEFWRGAHNLFTGPAKTWFIANRGKWASWSEFEPEFLQNFKPANFDSRLWQQLRLRTQGREERLNLYVAEMQRSFSLLEFPPHEAERLSFLKERLNPFLLKNLPLSKIKTLDELVAEGLKLESVQSLIDNYREPVAPDNPVQPSLVYKKPNSRAADSGKASAAKASQSSDSQPRARAATVAVDGTVAKGDNRPNWTQGGAKGSNFVPGSKQPHPAFARANSDPGRARRCWNCAQPGHTYVYCPSKVVNFFCWGCGAQGVSRKTCKNEKCRRAKNVQEGPAGGNTQPSRPANSADGPAASGAAS